jgi:hypothetical protein
MNRTIPVSASFLLHISVSGLVLSLGWLWFSPAVADPDLWGHVRFGQDILRTRSIIQRDVYSYRTGDQPWINHEWLSEATFALLYNRGGTAALAGLKAGASLLILGCAHAYLCARGLGPWRSALLVALICIPLRMGIGTIRPQLFTYLFFLVALVVLSTADTGREYRLWLLPVLLAVWVNLHGGVLAGAGGGAPLDDRIERTSTARSQYGSGRATCRNCPHCARGSRLGNGAAFQPIRRRAHSVPPAHCHGAAA